MGNDVQGDVLPATIRTFKDDSISLIVMPFSSLALMKIFVSSVNGMFVGQDGTRTQVLVT